MATRKKSTGTTRKKAAGGRQQTERKIVSMTEAVVKESLAGRDPFVDVPSRTLANSEWNEKRGIITMGDAAQRRNLFNLGQARKFMQTMLVAAGCKELAEQDKTTPIRDMFYHCKHT
ncbi:MAG: hypothetical protein ACR2GY_12640, partial [Phycisphaerales bacterium]